MSGDVDTIAELNKRINDCMDALELYMTGMLPGEPSVSELQPHFRRLLDDLERLAEIRMKEGLLGDAAMHLSFVFHVLQVVPWAAGSLPRQEEVHNSTVEMLASCFYGLGLIRECCRLGKILDTDRGDMIVEHCEKQKTKPIAVVENLESQTTPYDLVFKSPPLQKTLQQKDTTAKEKPKLAQTRAKSAMGFSAEIDKLLSARDARTDSLTTGEAAAAAAAGVPEFQSDLSKKSSGKEKHGKGGGKKWKKTGKKRKGVRKHESSSRRSPVVVDDSSESDKDPSDGEGSYSEETPSSVGTSNSFAGFSGPSRPLHSKGPQAKPQTAGDVTEEQGLHTAEQIDSHDEDEPGPGWTNVGKSGKVMDSELVSRGKPPNGRTAKKRRGKRTRRDEVNDDFPADMEPTASDDLRVVQENSSVLHPVLALLKSCDIHLACSQCFDKRNRNVRSFQHSCRQNYICSRKQKAKDSPWYKVRKDKGSLLQLCIHRIPLCSAGKKCGSAHSEVELVMWENDHSFTEIVHLLKSRIVLSSSALVSLPNAQGVKCIYEGVMGCSECSSLVQGAWSVSYQIPHECLGTDLLIRSPGAQKGTWLRMRKRIQRKPLSGYEVCRHVEKGCWKERECMFAHSELEKVMWSSDAKGKISIAQVFKDLTSTPPQLQLSQSQPQTAVGTDSEASTDASDEEIEEDSGPRKKAGSQVLTEPQSDESSSGGSTSGVKDNWNLVCPFEVVHICSVCFTQKYGYVVSYRNGDSCSNKKSSHLWKTNKHAAVKDENQKFHLVRDLPRLRGRVTIGKGGKAKMCGHQYIKKEGSGRTQVSICDTFNCPFAHNHLEMRLWTWLVNNDLDVEDVVSEYEPIRKAEALKSGGARERGTLAPALPPQNSQWNPMTKEYYASDGMMSALTMEEMGRARYYCFLCDKSPANLEQDAAHSKTRHHLQREKIDNQMQWNFGKPKSPEPYLLCDRHGSGSEAKCTKAHSSEELMEWKERKKHLVEQLSVHLTKEHQDLVIRVSTQKDKVGIHSHGGFVMDPAEHTLTVSSNSSTEWTFHVNISAEKTLQRVALLKKDSINYFRFAKVVGNHWERLEDEHGKGSYFLPGTEFKDPEILGYYVTKWFPLFEVQIQFLGAQSNKTYDTEVVFDLGWGQKLITQKLYIHSGLKTWEIQKLSEIIKLMPEQSELWNTDTAHIVWIRQGRPLQPPLRANEVVQNLQMEVSPQNYCKLMGAWLTAEQQARQRILGSFRLCAEAEIYDYLEWGEARAIAPRDRQYALVPVESPLSEDVHLTALLLSDCDFVFVSPVPSLTGHNGKIKVYEAELVGKHNSGFDFKGVTQNHVFLLLSPELTRELKKNPGDKVKLTIQFNISNSQFDQWKAAIRRLEATKNIDIVFPDLERHYRTWYHSSAEWWKPHPSIGSLRSDFVLNEEQKLLLHHAVYARCRQKMHVPPLVVFGPFGTGKTRSMAFAAAQILLGEGGWSPDDGLVLICTHSHPTADMYLELIEKMVSHKISREELRQVMVRLFPKGRRVDTLSAGVRPYVPVEEDGALRQLTTKDIQYARVVVCTLFGTNRLLQLCDQGHKLLVSHIFIDEAAQSLEVETLMPLCLASPQTRVVVAGDHNQIRPKVYLGGKVANELSLSYLERLHMHYDRANSKLDAVAQKQYRIPKLLFNKNYRCHEGILQFISAEFYGKDNSLRACGESPVTGIPPLSFAVAQDSVEMQLEDSTSWSNEGEAKMVASRVEFLVKHWPRSWGEIDIGIAVAFHDQVGVVRETLWNIYHCRRGILTPTIIKNNITIGKVITMQGKEYKALIISTVLTRRLLQDQVLGTRNLEFLDDEKLMNTALTRAKYAVIVVGDPLALCMLGQCHEQWQHYISCCSRSDGGLHPRGVSWEMIKKQMEQYHAQEKKQEQQPTAINKSGGAVDKFLLQTLDPAKLIQQLVEKTESEIKKLDECAPSERDEAVDYSSGSDEEIESESSRPDGVEAVLHIISSYRIYAAPLDRSEVINIRNRKFCQTAFNGDHVLAVETDRNEAGKRFGKVVDVIQRFFHPEKRSFACFADPRTLGMMVPIDPQIPKMNTNPKRGKKGSLTKLQKYRFLSDGSPELDEEIPITKVNCQENIFIVMYIRWDKKFFCPLGMIIDKIPLEKDKTKVDVQIKQGLHIININHEAELSTWDLGCYRRAEQIKKIISNKSMTKDDKRQDLRQLFCFTIDPEGSTDLDDAISIEEIDQTFVKVGVHIADVTAVIEKGDPIDIEASARTQTLYSEGLDKPKHMLLDDLSSNHLSLLPQKERLAISVFFTMTRDRAKISNVEVSRSWIVSKLQLTYAQADGILASEADGSTIQDSLRKLYEIACKQREIRLGSRKAMSVDVSHLQCPMSELLISELMILTNFEMAKMVHSMFPDEVPIRKQLPPSDDLLREWKLQHESVLSLSLKHSDLAIPGPLSISMFTLPTDVWDDIVHKSVEQKKFLVGAEELQPQLVPSAVSMRMIQEKGFYTPSSEALGVLSHHQLNLSIYMHFTSPIRRYIDMVAHRVLVAGLAEDHCPYNVEELKEICDRCTEMTWESRDYSRNCYNLKTAVNNQKTPTVLTATICKMDGLGISLEIPSLEKRVDSVKNLKFSQLELARNPRFDGQKVTLTWKKELYSLQETHEEGSKTRKTENIIIPTELYTTQIPVGCWKKIQDSIAIDDDRALVETIEEVKGCAISLKHPKLTSESCSTSLMQKQTVGFETVWKESSVLKVQLSARIMRGLLLPSIQLIFITPDLRLCTEHTRDPGGCFSLRPDKSVQEKYKKVFDYQKTWLQILMMECAKNVVYARNSVSIKDVQMTFSKRKNGSLRAAFQLEDDFCRRRMIFFTTWSQKGTDNQQLRAISRLDCFCVQVPINGFIWVGHFVSRRIDKDDMDENIWNIKCDLIHSGSAIPEELAEDKKRVRTASIEFFIASDPEIRMQGALSGLEYSSQLIQDIALGKCPTTSICGADFDRRIEIDDLLSRSKYDFPPVNSCQRDAILTSLTQPFTVIWGPPGTGKTVTAVQLACCFAKENKAVDCAASNLASFPKLLYVAPSNKAVNVVGKVFMEKVCPYDKSLRVVRVYSRELEIRDFPLPFDRPVSASPSDLDPKLKDVSLHHMIRDTKNTKFAARIRELDKRFREIREESQYPDGIRTPFAEVRQLQTTFKNIVKLAEKEVMRKCHIILCTSTAANPARLHFLQTDESAEKKEGVGRRFQIKQVILDEASMSCEPESLIPLVTTDCESVVLVGDHQQLSPVVLCKEAKEYGMDTTLFSKYYTNAVMLKKQYRMHESIVDFPSRQFYGGMLEVGLEEQKGKHPVWPGWGKRVVLCHCEGVEERRVITTDDACESSASNWLEADHVLRIVKRLVRRGGVVPTEVAVLSQYRAQTALIENELKSSGDGRLARVNVQTVIKSQGGEWDYVIFTTVRSIPDPEIDREPSMRWIQNNLGSIADQHQVCVALTRARKGLAVIGNKNLLSVDETWRNLIDDYQQKGCIVEAATFMHNG